MAGAAAVAVPCLAYPAWYAVFGPQRVVGPTQPVTSPGIDLVGAAVPADRYLLGGDVLGWYGPNVPRQGDMAFLGLPLLIGLAWVMVRYRHLMAVRVATVGGLAAWLLALGPRLVVSGRVTHIPLPFALLTRIPVLRDVVPSRLALYVDGAAAVLLAVGIGALVDKARAAIRSADRRARATRAKTVTALSFGAAGIAATLAPLLPAGPLPRASIGAAQQFAAGPLSGHIAAGAVVLTFPYPAYPHDQAMLWQAEDAMRFSLIGGYALRPDPNPALNKTPLPLTPGAVPALLNAAGDDDVATGLPDAARRQLRGFLSRYHITAIVVDTTERKQAAPVVTLFSTALGGPRRSGPLDVWGVAATP